MGFESTLAEHDRPPIKGPPCSIGLTLSRMGETDAAALQAALDNELVAHSAIVDALIDEGYRVGRDAVQRHRRDQCQCWKTRNGVR